MDKCIWLPVDVFKNCWMGRNILHSAASGLDLHFCSEWLSENEQLFWSVEHSCALQIPFFFFFFFFFFFTVVCACAQIRILIYKHLQLSGQIQHMTNCYYFVGFFYFFYYIFFQKIGFDLMYKSFSWKTMCMKGQILLAGSMFTLKQ